MLEFTLFIVPFAVGLLVALTGAINANGRVMSGVRWVFVLACLSLILVEVYRQTWDRFDLFVEFVGLAMLVYSLALAVVLLLLPILARDFLKQ